ncbi:hypothetical protein [Acinetobacter sp. MB5]|uniref:hypothetical protein n=1 Tax=Acinetobacter sp. MB5 TaxID=2069438 RepID=UPI001D0DB1F1|nr:hypothetical protein [Acinetobacter sp. MB5]
MTHFHTFAANNPFTLFMLVASTGAVASLCSNASLHSLFVLSSNNSCHVHHPNHHTWRHSTLHQDQAPPNYPFAPQFDPTSPELIQELMAPFGHDSLAEKAQSAEQSHRKRRVFGINHHKTASHKKVSTDSHWVKHVLSDLSKMLPFQNDMNLGSNSDSDVYVELSAEKNWKLSPKFSFNAAQTFRYGAESRNYSETNFKFTQQESKTTLASTQFSVVKTYDETYTWDNHLFRQQQFPDDNRLTYGIYSNGIYDKTKRDIEVQSWGPYLSWRRPLWRNWIYIENEVSYYKDLTSDNGRHILSTSLQFDTNF